MSEIENLKRQNDTCLKMRAEKPVRNDAKHMYKTMTAPVTGIPAGYAAYP